MTTSDKFQNRRQQDRYCTNCGKSAEDAPYLLWLFHTCASCGAERAPPRWRDGKIGPGTYGKWRYFPRWHMTQHPGLPEHVRARHEVNA